MDFVDWTHITLKEINKLARQYSSEGVGAGEIANSLYGESFFNDSPIAQTFADAVGCAIEELVKAGFAKKLGRDVRALPTQRGKEFLQDPISFWGQVCQTRLDDEQEKYLKMANSLSPQSTAHHCQLTLVHSDNLSGLFPDDPNLLFTIVKELAELGFIERSGGIPAGKHFFRSTYRGLVWEIRRAITLESAFIDQLVSEWETTSIDFKRELYLNNDNQKAEFVKDVLGLANTQASGKRWIIIGFDDKTRKYHCAPDPGITQNRLEQILACYTSPMVNIRYEVVEYKSGRIGKLEVLRNPIELPYKVAKTIGGKKQITVSQLFVRHGSQTEEPTSTELLALQEERDFAKAKRMQSS